MINWMTEKMKKKETQNNESMPEIMHAFSIFILYIIIISANVCNAIVLTGIDNFLLHYSNLVKNKRIGIVTNQTGYTSAGIRTIDAIRELPDATLGAVFTPEHGLTGTVHAGEQVLSYFDTSLGVNVYSLYGRQRKPTPEMLKGIDLLIYDIQDIGVRSYTFISTLGLVMQSASENNIPVVVLDRPCPLAMHIDGNVLDTAYRSFVGMYPIPYVYGMTPGELARMINEEGMVGKRCDLTVIPVLNWQRSMTWEETGLRWIPPSPNIPHPSTVAYYAAFGVIGELGIGAYTGIGTSEAFRIFSLPHLDCKKIQALFTKDGMQGIRCSPYDTIMMNGGKSRPIEGIKFYIALDKAGDLTVAGLELISLLVKMRAISSPDSAHSAMFTKVCGSPYLERILDGEPIAQISREWEPDREKFLAIRKKYLLYR